MQDEIFDKDWISGDLGDDEFEESIEAYGSYIRSFCGELHTLERIFVDLNLMTQKSHLLPF